MNTLDIVRIAAAVAAFAAAGSKLISSTLPFWSYFPPAVQRWIPGVVLVLGALPAALAGVTTPVEFVTALLGAVALALPGRHTDQPKPLARRAPKPPGLYMLGLVALLSVTSCTAGARVSWPAVLQCATPIGQDLLAAVSGILLSGGDPGEALDALARQLSADAVACAVQNFISDASPTASGAARAAAAERGRAFLAARGMKADQ